MGGERIDPQVDAAPQDRALSRRQFVARLTGTALAVSAARQGFAQPAPGDKVTLGLIGCGGRGTWIADLFAKHGGYQIVAAADYFEDRVKAFGDRFGVPESRRTTGLSAYRKLLEDPPDAVAIESPPFFHPDQAWDAVQAGCHVYLAKPVAVDVPGCLKIQEAGKAATEAGLCFLADFQTRTNPLYREAIKRVHFGEIGRIFCGEASYVTGRLGIQTPPGTPEARLRNWVFDRALSGDIITEQNIHALDVACWILDAAPRSAVGTGGRTVRTDVGDCWDHFSVLYQFPEDVLLTFHSKQAGQGWDDILCRIYGSRGTVDTHYFGEVSIRGDRPYKGGPVQDLYRDGAARNIAEFYESMRERRFDNPTVPASVRSNLTTILGRTAAYRGGPITWEEMMASNERLVPDLSGLTA